MDFQVNEIIFGENSIFELMTLPIPFKYVHKVLVRKTSTKCLTTSFYLN